jgi:hypothetical protein
LLRRFWGAEEEEHGHAKYIPAFLVNWQGLGFGLTLPLPLAVLIF